MVIDRQPIADRKNFGQAKLNSPGRTRNDRSVESNYNAWLVMT
ncbi:MAG: hypothetical protein ACRC62_29825 [Microcoleus sp.]